MSVVYETAVAIIDDNVHGSCDYNTYSTLRDAVDAMENENDELREIIGELYDDLLFSCGECWLSGDVRTCDNEGCGNYKTYQRCARSKSRCLMNEHNCPNCGAVIHDCICDYCGTVFPSSTFDFQGKRCMLITVDDNGNVHAMGLRVHSVERSAPEHYYTMDAIRYDYRVDEVTLTGTADDLPTTSHGLRELGRIFSERFGDI